MWPQAQIVEWIVRAGLPARAAGLFWQLLHFVHHCARSKLASAAVCSIVILLPPACASLLYLQAHRVASGALATNGPQVLVEPGLGPRPVLCSTPSLLSCSSEHSLAANATLSTVQSPAHQNAASQLSDSWGVRPTISRMMPTPNCSVLQQSGNPMAHLNPIVYDAGPQSPSTGQSSRASGQTQPSSPLEKMAFDCSQSANSGPQPAGLRVYGARSQLHYRSISLPPRSCLCPSPQGVELPVPAYE